MKRIFLPVLSLLTLLALLSLPLSAQAPTAIPAQKEAMKKLDFLVGKWKGEGWVKMPGAERQTFTQTETVQKKLGGLALLFEGHGTSKLPSGEEKTVFEALAMVTWDPEKNRYRFSSATTEGRAGESEGRFTADGAWEWGFALPQGGRIRYTIKLTDKGEWYETGQYSPDEKTWHTFHEMTLRKLS